MSKFKTGNLVIDKTKLPRQKYEELRKKEDELLTKEVYEEFCASFDAPTNSVKTFVRGETVKHGPTGTERKPPTPGNRLYKPTTALYKPPKTAPESPFDQAKRAAEETARKIMEQAQANRPSRSVHHHAAVVTSSHGKKKGEDTNKPKSNLEAFKDELKRIQEERAERRKIRDQLKDQLGITDAEHLEKIAGSVDPYAGLCDTDPNTTNLFLSNLAPQMTEEELCRIFGKYGPLASVKVMWPRTDEERSRGYMSGFVAYMTRVDGERAYFALRNKNVMGFEMKMGWAKTVPIPPHPVYVPPAMMEMTLPPPPSGLPFNAQPRKEDRAAYRWPLPPPGAPPPLDLEQRDAWEKMIRNAVVKVVIPTERPLLCLIHRTIEFVVREGPMFEAMIMNRELSSPMFRFLFDNQSPAHVYYRWRLYCLLHGDTAQKWDTKEFRMFENGSLWKPPPMDFFQKGMPTELYEDETPCFEDFKRESVSPTPSATTDTAPANASSARSKRGQLSSLQREQLDELLKNLSVERDSICEAMCYCMEYAESAEEIVDCIYDSLTETSSLPKKIARLYLISDILGNCSAKVHNVFFFRKFIGNRLEDIFRSVGKTYQSIEARIKAEQFKTRVVSCFRAWEDSVIYPVDVLIKLQNIFLGLEKTVESDLDGAPIAEEHDLDGVPLSAARSPETTAALVDYDLDGVPMGKQSPEQPSKNNSKEHEHRTPAKREKNTSAMFVKSKWEEVEPELVEQQAMTTSKWELLDQHPELGVRPPGGGLVAAYDEDDIDGVPMDDEPSPNATLQTKFEMTEERRARLREIEVKVVKYQDELESGRRNRDSGRSMHQQVEDYRQKLLRKLDESSLDSPNSGRRDSDSGGKSRKRSRSPKKSKHKRRSRSGSRERSKKHKKHH